MGAADFTPIRGAMWEGETAMACKGDPVALWLMAFLPTHFAGHSSGVFRFQRDFVAFRYGFTDAQLLAALEKLQATGFVLYDRRTDWVFVTRLAEIRHPGGFRTPGKRQADMATYFRKHLAACPSPMVMDAFMGRYGETHTPARPHSASLGLTSSHSVSPVLTPPHSVSLRLSETENADPRLSEINKTPYSLIEAPRVTGTPHGDVQGYKTETETETETETAAAARAHEREAAGPARVDPEPPRYRADRRDPWPEEAAARALAAYQTELERVALVPQGDPDEPFERAAVYLRDRLRHDPATIPATLAAIVAMAAKDPTFRAHPKHGDLFLRPNALMGRRAGSPDNLGVDVKIPEWLNRLAQARSTSKPRPSTHVSGAEDARPPTEADRAEIARILEAGRAMLAAKRQAAPPGSST